jgi:hypothetical protein
MANITKCTGDNCPIKEKCYRFTAISSKYQSWFSPPYGRDEPNTCYYFLSNSESPTTNGILRLG